MNAETRELLGRTIEWRERAERAEARVTELAERLRELRVGANDLQNQRDAMEAERDAALDVLRIYAGYTDAIAGPARAFLSTRTPRETT